jgi:hypothetical protein
MFKKTAFAIAATALLTTGAMAEGTKSKAEGTTKSTVQDSGVKSGQDSGTKRGLDYGKRGLDSGVKSGETRTSSGVKGR